MTADLADGTAVPIVEPIVETVRFEACATYGPDAAAPGGPCLACGWLDRDHEPDGAVVAALPVAPPLRRAS